MELERVPDVGPLLDVLDVAVDVGQRGGAGQQPVLQLVQIEAVEALQLFYQQVQTGQQTGAALFIDSAGR